MIVPQLNGIDVAELWFQQDDATSNTEYDTDERIISRGPVIFFGDM